MEEVNLSVLRLMKQIKVLTQQSLRLSEDLECAYERISVLERELQVCKTVSQRKQEIYGMKILHAETKGV